MSAEQRVVIATAEPTCQLHVLDPFEQEYAIELASGLIQGIAVAVKLAGGIESFVLAGRPVLEKLGLKLVISCPEVLRA